MLLEHGYHGLGIQAVLEAASAPKGSFYHHFVDKEDFALQVIDRYMAAVHDGLEETYRICMLSLPGRPGQLC
jgi:TetR/AcrR family transcriptional repressor of nem operon